METKLGSSTGCGLSDRGRDVENGRLGGIGRAILAHRGAGLERLLLARRPRNRRCVQFMACIAAAWVPMDGCECDARARTRSAKL